MCGQALMTEGPILLGMKIYQDRLSGDQLAEFRFAAYISEFRSPGYRKLLLCMFKTGQSGMLCVSS